MSIFTNKTILVTGATGFIGQHLCARLEQIPGLHLLRLSRRAAPGMLACELQQLTKEFWQNQGVKQIDYVFHLGAFTPKNASEANAVAIEESNIAGTEALLASLPNISERILFASTLDVYAPTDATIDESTPTTANSGYAASKLAGEIIVSEWAVKNNSQVAILRYGHIYGPGEERYQKLIPATIKTLREGRAPTLQGDGSALRDYLYVADAVEATIRAMENADSNPINIVRGESVMLRDVVQQLLQVSRSNLSITYDTSKPNGTSYRFDATRMKQQLGEWNVTSLLDGLAAEWNGTEGMTHAA